jgi:hypothetical protein
MRFERQMTGKHEVSDHVEMVKWGVEEAREQHNKDASKSHFTPLYPAFLRVQTT